MRQLENVANIMARALGIFIAFCSLCAQAQAEVQNSITTMNISSDGGGATIVKVELARPLDNPPTAFTILAPPRVAFDFPNTANGSGKSVQNFTDANLRSANIVQAGNRTRMVVNLNHMTAFDTKVDGNILLITFHGKSADLVAASPTSRFAEAKKETQKHSLRDIDFHRGKNGEGRIQIDLSDSGVGIDMRQQGATLIVEFLKTDLPANLQRKLDVVDFSTPVQVIDTFVQGDNVRMVIEPKGSWEHAAYQTDNKFIVEVKPVIVKADESGRAKKTGYVGEKLTLNFQQITVREALNVIADFTETNMVISDTVSGTLTLRLKDVPWDQAFDIILQSRGLAMRKNGNVIQVAPRDEMAAKEKIELTMNQEIAELEELRTESFQLSYQKGDAMAALLSSDKQRILSKRGSAVVDARTNTLFIQDTTTHLEEARKLIKQIDVPVRQVMIEARFVSASNTFSRNLGGKLGFARQGKLSSTGMPANIALGSGTAPTTGVSVPSGSAGAGALALSLFNAAATKVLSLELTASEIDGVTKNIASPRVITADNKTATIKDTNRIYIQSATSSGATAATAQDIGLQLTVTPQITPDDHINLKVVANDGALAAGGGITTKEITTEVLVENGGTVVIGGVFKQSAIDESAKVPLLGDIPILGWLFKSNSKGDIKSELLIFITPRIMSEALSLR